MHPNRASASAMLAFASGYLATGVIAQFAVRDPTERSFALTTPNEEGLAAAAIFAILATAPFMGGLWLRRRLAPQVTPPLVARAFMIGVVSCALFVGMAWALEVEGPPIAETPAQDGSGNVSHFSHEEGDGSTLSPAERTAGLLMIFGLPAVLAFGFGARGAPPAPEIRSQA